MTLHRRPEIVLRCFNNNEVQEQVPIVMDMIKDVDEL